MAGERQTLGEKVLSGRGNEKKHLKILLKRENFLPSLEVGHLSF
jgi:hypothetical protein